MGKVSTGANVYESALDRFLLLHQMDMEPVVSMSGGKDSTVCLELAVEAARKVGRLPVRACMRDEEIMMPGTFEYCERLLERPTEVEFYWVIMGQAAMNVFDRLNPYWWVFDPLEEAKWVRPKPPWAMCVDSGTENLYTLHRAAGLLDPKVARTGGPVASVCGIRADESQSRLLVTNTMHGFMSSQYRTPDGRTDCYPIYDWKGSDVWTAIKEKGWDYNTAYDAMCRAGMSVNKARIAPPTLNYYGAEHIRLAAVVWPDWFDRVCERLPGVRNVALFGATAYGPQRRYRETWAECFQRVCVDDAPEWIANRATRVRDATLTRHAKHSRVPFPEVMYCSNCGAKAGSWRGLTWAMYNGDPFSMHQIILPWVEPDFFRPGSGTWGQGRPAFE